METVAFIGWVGLFFGVVSRVFVPYLNARRNNPEEADWSWRYLWPQLISVVVVALLLPLVLSNLESIGTMPLSASYIVGWGAADIGRFVDKAVTKS